MVQRVEYGVRLSDVRMDFLIEVPARSLDHAEEVVNWHNDPRHESCYEATAIQRVVVTSNWEPVAFPARNVTT